MITATQVQKASRSARRNAFYLVKENDVTIGMIEKPYHNKDYRAQVDGRTVEVCSTKKQAIRTILRRKGIFGEWIILNN